MINIILNSLDKIIVAPQARIINSSIEPTLILYPLYIFHHITSAVYYV